MTPANPDALADALAYLKPHETNGGTISFKASKAREAVAVIEAALSDAEARAAQLQAEVEAKDRALKLLLPFVDYAAGEGLMFVETEDGDHPEMDAAEIVAFAAQTLGLDLGGCAYLTLILEGYAAIRTEYARAVATRKDGLDD